MRSILSKFILIALSFTLSTMANAGFHLEPYIGYALSADVESGSTSEDLSMTNFGTKLGYQTAMGLHFGGDIQLGATNYDSGSTSIGGGAAAFGAYVGYQSAFGLRGYFSYLPSAALVTDEFLAVTYTGSGMKAGVGYSILRWLAINAEYVMMTYDQAEVSGVTTTLTDDLKHNGILVTVSFPFNFGGKK